MYSGGLEAAAGGTNTTSVPVGTRKSAKTNSVRASHELRDVTTPPASDVVRELRTRQSAGLSKENVERARSATRWAREFTAGLVAVDLAAAGAASATGLLTGFGTSMSTGSAALVSAVALPAAWVSVSWLDRAY